MGERLTGNFDQNHVDGFEAMQDEGKADSYSEAVRRASTVGLQQMGYINGESTDTLLKRGLSKVGVLLALTGIIGLAFTFAYPVPARVPSFSVLIVGAGMYAGSEVLEEYEPNVTRKLKQLVGGEKA
jgi:hypothetical protein